MAEKKVIGNLKLRIPAGRATAGPPVGSTLGQWGLNMMDFIKRYKRVYPKEIEVCFSLDENQTSLMLNTLSQSRRIHTTPVGNSSCISPMQSKQALSQSLDNIFSQPKDSKNTKNHKSPQKESNKIKEEA